MKRNEDMKDDLITCRSDEMLNVAERARELIVALQKAYPSLLDYRDERDTIEARNADENIIRSLMFDASETMSWATDQALRAQHKERVAK